MPQLLTDDEQQLVLEYIFNDRKLFIQSLGVFKPEYFEPPLDRAVEFSIEYFQKHHAIPDFDIIKVKTGVTFEVREIQPDEYDYCLEEVENHCRLAAVKIAFSDCIDRFDEGDISGIEYRFRDALSVAIKKELGTNQFENVAKRLQRMQENIDSRSIGCKTLDILTDGIRRGEMYLFAAETSAGKSVTLANVANWLAKDGLNVAIVTLELSEELTAKRMDSIITGIDSYSVFENIESVVELLKEKQSKYGSIITKKLPNGSNANDIRNYLMEYHLENGFYPDVLCVDYLDLMTPVTSRPKDGIFDVDKNISEELRDVFVEFNLYGFSASQLNRDATDLKRITKAHIAGGRSKLNTADVAVAIAMGGDDPDNDTGERLFQQLKIRNAARHPQPITLYLDPKTLRLTESPVRSSGNSIITGAKSQKRISDLLNNKKSNI